MPTKKIILDITNTQSYPVTISLLGGNQDPMRLSVNSSTLYTWDLTSINFSANATFTLEFKRTGAASFSTIDGMMKNSFGGLIYGLNQLNLGFFWYQNLVGATYPVYSASDYYEFGNLTFPV